MNRDCYVCGIGSAICESCRELYISPSDIDPIPVAARPEYKIGHIDLNDISKSIPFVQDAPIPVEVQHYDVRKERDKIDDVVNRGFKVIRSTPTTILLDLDNQKSIDTFNEMHAMLNTKINVNLVEYWQSKSGTGTHVLMHLDYPLSARTRIAIQAILGSDLKRELLNIYKLEKYGIAEPSLLFQPPNTRVQKLPVFSLL